MVRPFSSCSVSIVWVRVTGGPCRGWVVRLIGLVWRAVLGDGGMVSRSGLDGRMLIVVWFRVSVLSSRSPMERVGPWCPVWGFMGGRGGEGGVCRAARSARFQFSMRFVSPSSTRLSSGSYCGAHSRVT